VSLLHFRAWRFTWEKQLKDIEKEPLPPLRFINERTW
jgi:hypothetical protein